MYTYPPPSIARYSFIQLSELEQCRVKIIAQSFKTAAQYSNPGSRSRESEALPLSHCALCPIGGDFRSKPKRPDVAIYVPRGRRQQEHTNTQTCPSEHGESTQEKPAKKSAEKSGRHTGALSMPRLRRPQREKIGNQESAAVSSIRTDVPPEGDTSHGTLIVTGEDSLGDAVKHKAKRKKGSSRTPDEKTGRDTVKKDGKKKRKDGLELVAPPGDMKTKGSSESEICSLHSHDDSLSISPEYADTSLLVESGHISCGTSIEERVQSQDALQSVDIDQLQVSATRCDGNAETMSPEPSGQSNSAEKDDDKSHQPLVDADQLPGNRETDGSHELTGSHVEAAIPAVELVECTDVPRSCSDQMESQLNDKSCLTDEDVCRNVDLETLGETAALENEVKVSCGECMSVEDLMVEQCVTKRSNNNAKEVGLGAKLDTEPETQQPYGGDNISQNVHTTMESKNVVDATSELKLSVCSEKPLTTDSLTGTISGSGCGCGAPCRCGTSENSATGDALVTRDHECCTGVGEAGNGEGRCISEESEQLEDGLNCEHENKLKESDNETHSTNELAGNKVNEQAATEICKSKCEKSERSVCDDNESESNVDMQDDIDVLGETESNVHSGNNVSEDESVTYNIESGNENESCQLKPSSDDTGRVQSKPDVASKKTKKRVKVENVKTASSDIGKLPDSACVSHQGDSVAMEAEDEDEDDSWDKLFDDTGEALDPKLVEEVRLVHYESKKLFVIFFGNLSSVGSVIFFCLTQS